MYIYIPPIPNNTRPNKDIGHSPDGCTVKGVHDRYYMTGVGVIFGK